MSKDLLVEIGTEELPPKALPVLSRAFLEEMRTQLQQHGLAFADIRPFASPRRLALVVSALTESQPDREIEKFGPAVKAAFNADGNPTPAAKGFARSCGVEVEDLERGEMGGVEKLLFRSTEKGKNTGELLAAMVSAALSKLPIPKPMRWGSSREEFVRPVHWVVLLFGSDTVKADILGVESGRLTRGHRVHHPEPIELQSPEQYENLLRSPGHVIADFSRRKEKIRAQVQAQSDKLEGSVIIDEDLLDEVTSLVEWPVALTGRFDEHFLEVPPEALISSMKSHQKCFHVTGKKAQLLPYFITVSNLESREPQRVIEGNERVIRPRLADAAFFYDTDRRRTLESRRTQLDKIVFQEKLGTVFAKAERVAALARFIAEKISFTAPGAAAAPAVDPALCERAARLSKCDLVTSMVGEFPELQGIMGYYYARHDGEPEELARALNEQYMPRFAGDRLPETATGCVLAVADKLDTIAGLFATGQPPTGSRDPFALRRSAIGILRILIEKRLDLDLVAAIAAAVGNQPVTDAGEDTRNAIFEFLLERFRAWYQEEGIRNEEFEAVFVLRPANPLDFHQRVRAVHQFNRLPEAEALAAANKRVSNILAKLDEPVDASILDESLLQDKAEQELARLVAVKQEQVLPLFRARDYAAGLQALAETRATVDRFFDDVLVMCEDPDLRRNRLALLAQLRQLFLQAADVSCLHRA